MGDYAGTDQIYIGGTQTGSHDGYSGYGGRINWPQVFTLDYSSLVPINSAITSLTLGIAADDFQFPSFGQPFTASINGVTNTALTNQLNSFDQTGPFTQLFTIDIAPSTLTTNGLLTFSINQAGDGGDGWAVDFLTIGVTTFAVATSAPEPGSLALISALGIAGSVFGGSVSLRRKPLHCR